MHDDLHYDLYRREQERRFDEDYRTWRRERFERDFGTRRPAAAGRADTQGPLESLGRAISSTVAGAVNPTLSDGAGTKSLDTALDSPGSFDESAGRRGA